MLLRAGEGWPAEEFAAADEDEILEVKRLTVQEVKQAMVEGALVNAKSIVAYARATLQGALGGMSADASHSCGGWLACSPLVMGVETPCVWPSSGDGDNESVSLPARSDNGYITATHMDRTDERCGLPAH
jgi:hypothetical protein